MIREVEGDILLSDAQVIAHGIATADPFDSGLALALRGGPAPSRAELLALLRLYGQLIKPRVAPRHRGGRLKQWLNMLRRRHVQAQQAYDAVRALHDAADIERCLFGAA